MHRLATQLTEVERTGGLAARSAVVKAQNAASHTPDPGTAWCAGHTGRTKRID